MKKRNVKGLTLTAGIINLLLSLLILFVTLAMAIPLFAIDDKAQVATLGILIVLAGILLLVGLVLFLVFLISGIMLLVISLKTDEKYANSKRLVIISFIFDIIAIILCVVTIIFAKEYLIVAICVGVMFILTATFTMIDYKMFWKKVKNGTILIGENKPVQAAVTEKTNNPVNLEQPETIAVNNNETANNETVADENKEN